MLLSSASSTSAGGIPANPYLRDWHCHFAALRAVSRSHTACYSIHILKFECWMYTIGTRRRAHSAYIFRCSVVDVFLLSADRTNRNSLHCTRQLHPRIGHPDPRQFFAEAISALHAVPRQGASQERQDRAAARRRLIRDVSISLIGAPQLVKASGKASVEAASYSRLGTAANEGGLPSRHVVQAVETGSPEHYRQRPERKK